MQFNLAGRSQRAIAVVLISISELWTANTPAACFRSGRRCGYCRSCSEPLQSELGLRSLVVPLQRYSRSLYRRGASRTLEGLCLSFKARSLALFVAVARPRRCR